MMPKSRRPNLAPTMMKYLDVLENFSKFIKSKNDKWLNEAIIGCGENNNNIKASKDEYVTPDISRGQKNNALNRMYLLNT